MATKATAPQTCIPRIANLFIIILQSIVFGFGVIGISRMGMGREMLPIAFDHPFFTDHIPFFVGVFHVHSMQVTRRTKAMTATEKRKMAQIK